MRNDSLTKSGYWNQTQLDWVSDWHTKWVAGLTSTKDYPHQVGGETGSLASRWIACSLTKSPRHWEILFATHLVSRGHSPLSQWYHKTSMQNLILKKLRPCPIPSRLVFLRIRWVDPESGSRLVPCHTTRQPLPHIDAIPYSCSFSSA